MKGQNRHPNQETSGESMGILLTDLIQTSGEVRPCGHNIQEHQGKCALRVNGYAFTRPKKRRVGLSTSHKLFFFAMGPFGTSSMTSGLIHLSLCMQTGSVLILRFLTYHFSLPRNFSIWAGRSFITCAWHWWQIPWVSMMSAWRCRYSSMGTQVSSVSRIFLQ